MNSENVESLGEQNDNKFVKVLSEHSTLMKQIQISLNDQKNELSALREEIKNSRNAQNQNQATFEEQLKCIEAAMKSVTITTTTPVSTTTTPVSTTTTIKNAKFDENLNCIEIYGDPKDLPNDCWEVKKENENVSGVFILKPPQGSQLKPFGAYCLNHENKNWIIIQRRLINKTVSFNRNWEEYTNGFGDLSGDYWLGLERIHQLTANKNYELWMEERDKNGDTLSSHYSEFSVAAEGNGYRLKVDGFSGDEDYLEDENGFKFSTYDKNNSGRESPNLARSRGSGWWYPDVYFYRFSRGLNSNWFKRYYVHMAIHPA